MWQRQLCLHLALTLNHMELVRVLCWWQFFWLAGPVVIVSPSQTDLWSGFAVCFLVNKDEFLNYYLSCFTLRSLWHDVIFKRR